MQTIEREVIHGHSSAPLCAGRAYHECFFDNFFIGHSPTAVLDGIDPLASRVTLRDLVFRDCRQRAVLVRGAILDAVTIDGLGREGRMPLMLQGAAFRHVVLRGKIAAPKINADLDSGQTPLNQRFREANRRFYDSVDWALDISEARFAGSVTFEALPGDKIRRNPATQVLVRRERIDAGVLQRQSELSSGSFETALRWFLGANLYDSVVLAATGTGKRLEDDLRALDRLRGEGIAEKD